MYSLLHIIMYTHSHGILHLVLELLSTLHESGGSDIIHQSIIIDSYTKWGYITYSLFGIKSSYNYSKNLKLLRKKAFLQDFISCSFFSKMCAIQRHLLCSILYYNSLIVLFSCYFWAQVWFSFFSKMRRYFAKKE